MAASSVLDKLNQIQALINEVRDILQNTENHNAQVSNTEKSNLSISITNKPPVIDSSNTAVVSQAKKKCIHIITKKDKKGQQCGSNVSARSTSGNYCSKHLNREQPAKEKKATSVQTKLTISKPKAQTESKVNNTELLKRKVVQSIVKNDKGQYVHTATNFIMDSIDNAKVIGKYTDAGMVDLTDRDILICRSNNFKYEIPVRMQNTCLTQEELKEPEPAMPTQDLSVPTEFELDVSNDVESEDEVSDSGE